jgi:hypothetical protein
MPVTAADRRWWVAALLALSAACGGSDGGESTAGRGGDESKATPAGEYRPPPDLTQLDVCALLPPAEIPARFGKVFEGPTSDRNPNGWPSCSYVLEPNTGLVVELLESEWYDMNRNVWEPGRTEDVPGVGEKAFLVKLRPPSDPHLVAAKGYVAVKVTTRNLDLARTAAQLVLSKL